ncbi:PD-(D/E)XK nuclease family protein [Bacillaceae bacterium W0354]
MPTATTIAKNTMTYSYSRLALFDRCERAFYHKYVEERPDPSGAPAIIGKIFHYAMELVVNEGYEPEDAVYASIYVHNGLPEGEIADSLIYMVNRTYTRLLDYQDEFADVTTELHLFVETEHGKLQGYLDLVVDNPALDELTIADYKTTWQPFSAEESQQLKLYGWMYKQMRGGYVSSNYKGKLIFPRRSEFADSDVLFSDEELEAAYRWAVDIMSQIESKDIHNMDEWEMTNERKKCEYCPYIGLCSSGFVNGLPSDGEPKDDLEAQAIGEYVRVQELAIKKMKDGLKNYAKDKGDITLRGGKWTFAKSDPSPKAPVELIKNYAEEHGFDLEEAFSVNTKTLKKWIEEDSTGTLSSSVKWSNPRTTFRFIESNE